jgi:hypothetical protein
MKLSTEYPLAFPKTEITITATTTIIIIIIIIIKIIKTHSECDEQ